MKAATLTEKAAAQFRALMTTATRQLLAAMQTVCVYRVNGLCWQDCPARWYCLPWSAGLADVSDLPREG